METDFANMALGVYQTQTPIIFVEAEERTGNHPQDLILIHEAAHKFFIEMTGSGNLLRSLLDVESGHPTDHPFVEKYFTSTRSIHECLALTIEGIYGSRRNPYVNVEDYLTDQYKGYYRLLEKFHPYLYENAARHSEDIILQFGILVFGEPFEEQTILVANGLESYESVSLDYFDRTVVLRFREACIALGKAISEHQDSVEMVAKALVDNFRKSWELFDQSNIEKLLAQLPDGRIKTFLNRISGGYSEGGLSLREVFRRVVFHAARQATVHFRARFDGVQLGADVIEKLLNTAEGLYVHIYPNLHAYPVNFMVQIPPGTCMILLDAVDRPLFGQSANIPYEAESLGRVIIFIENTVLPDTFAKIVSSNNTLVVTDPSFLEPKSAEIFGVKIPIDRMVILYNPVGTIGFIESLVFREYDKKSIETAFHVIHESRSETNFACVKPRFDGRWIMMSPLFGNELVDKYADQSKLMLPKSCKACLTKEEFGMSWSVEEPIVFFLNHNLKHGW